MAIRLRRIPGVGLIALCAARSVAKEGDVYLDDEVHHALTRKFHDDFTSEGRIPDPVPYGADDVAQAVEAEESNNPNRADWDAFFRSLPAGTPPEEKVK